MNGQLLRTTVYTRVGRVQHVHAFGARGAGQAGSDGLGVLKTVGAAGAGAGSYTTIVLQKSAGVGGGGSVPPLKGPDEPAASR